VVYRTKREKYNAIIDEIETYHEQRLPSLVGTVSVEVSETLSRMLRRRGIKHSVLNAKQHQNEAEIVARAGEPGMVTIATNMAGRGTDIKLGAGVIQLMEEDAEQLVQDAVSRFSHGKTVCVHEIPEANTSSLPSLFQKRDVLSQIIRTETEKASLLSGEKQGDCIYLLPKSIWGPKDTRDINDNVVHIKFRDYAAGGLHIIGTERHEARRIDRQLRGRSGRQGDPGSSRFFLSLEDDLMRLFAPDRIINVMDRLGVEEGEVISHSMITKSIERAQKRVEMRNFEIRKHLLEYDNVMNKQREVVYSRRRRALEGENLHEEIFEMIEDFIDDIIEIHTDKGEYSEGWDWEGLNEDLLKTMPLSVPVAEDERYDLKPEELSDKLQTLAKEAYDRKREALGQELMGQLERFATLTTIDDRWKEHLYEMDQLKEGIGLRAYGQKDPLLEYKKEGFRTFTEMLATINEQILEIVFKAQIRQQEGTEPLRGRRREPVEMAMIHKDTVGMGFAGQPEGQPEMPQAGKKQPVRVDKKVGRNDPCPCGSGKKYKHCHG